MKNLLKYLIPILMVAAFSCVAGRSDSSSLETRHCTGTIEDYASAASLSKPDYDLSIPRQIASSTTNLQGNARRIVNTHARTLFQIVKSGKALNAAVVYSVQRNSVIVNASVVEHAHKLVLLGKLII